MKENHCTLYSCFRSLGEIYKHIACIPISTPGLSSMTLSHSLKRFSNLISWKSTDRFQKTLKSGFEVSGKALHSGELSTVKISPAHAGKGRYFDFPSRPIPAFIDFVQQSPLCTTLCKDGIRIRTVEHLLSALEAMGVDNCCIQISISGQDSDFEVPVLDGSAREWVSAIEDVGVVEAVDESGNHCERFAPHLNETVHVMKNDSSVAAFPSQELRISYGIDFSMVPAIGSQWFTLGPFNETVYGQQIASARTFCVYEELEHMRNAGLIKGGSLDNAIVCSASKGWLNPPLRFPDEPCRHKVLDLVGDLSLFAQFGNQGLPVAHIVAYKGGHALHGDFVRHLSGSFKS